MSLLPSLTSSSALTHLHHGQPRLITAENDIDAVLTWLREYEDSPHTFASYRKETERFLMWMAEQKRTLSQLSRNDLMDFERFLANPQPAERWIGPAVARHHPNWRPFTKPLQPSSIQQTLVILSGLFRYLNEAGYLQGNPLALAKRKKRALTKKVQTVERYLDQTLWQCVLETLAHLPQDTEKERAHAVRANWLFSLLYLTGARRSEVADAVMGDIFVRRGQWWWRVIGKGNKEGEIPINDELLQQLVRYRTAIGLPQYPHPRENIPLVGRLSEKGQWNCLSSKSIYLITKSIFEQAAQYAEQQQQFDIAFRLRTASTHWLRHTSASHQLEAGIPLLVVSQNLRHSNIETTRRYLHTDNETRHQASQALRFTKTK